jgi:hypothetical protein
MSVFLAIVINSGGGGAGWLLVWLPVQAEPWCFFCFAGKSFSPDSFTQD